MVVLDINWIITPSNKKDILVKHQLGTRHLK